MPEILLQEWCPKCFEDNKLDNRLRAAPGSAFLAAYCVIDEKGTKGHTYNDTLELNADLIKVSRMRKKAGAKMTPASPEPKQTAVAVLEPQVDERTTSADTEQEIVPVREAAEFGVTETDALRLGELLGQPIPDAGTLIGAVYSMKMTAAVESGTEERRIAARITQESEIAQKNDGTLALQVYFPWSVGKGLAEKASFNNTELGTYVRNSLEYQFSSSYFPGGIIDIVPKDFGQYDGMWVVVNVPETYVGAMVNEAQTCGVTPTQYLQAFVDKCIQDEVFL